jgi:hypothetical protein
MRTFLIVDRLLNSDRASSYRTEIFESEYIMSNDKTKLMLGELDKGKELFRIRKIVNTSNLDVIDALKIAYKIDEFPKAIAVYEERLMETRE